MIPRIFTYVGHNAGVPDDSAAELIAATQKLDTDAMPIAVVCGSGVDLENACQSLTASYGEVWKIANDALAYPNAELLRKALIKILPPQSILILPHNHFGIDLGPGLSIKANSVFIPDILDIVGVNGPHIDVVRQEFGGQVNAHVRCDISAGAIITVRPGAFKPVLGSTAYGLVIDKSAALGELVSARRYVATVVAEAGDVDITKHDVLVSVGRGIEKQENVAIAQELADAMGGAISCSRPVVDAKWMEKSRQVGSSGKTVKPKIYLACGISGSFQHLVGIKGNPLIVAINKNPKAPIFQVADVGIVADILEFLPSLTKRIQEVKSGTVLASQ
jgi:electron transfer flavoprotein alpha subunit